MGQAIFQAQMQVGLFLEAHRAALVLKTSLNTLFALLYVEVPLIFS